MNPNEEWTRIKVSKNTLYILATLKDIYNCIDYDETIREIIKLWKEGAEE